MAKHAKSRLGIETKINTSFYSEIFNTVDILIHKKLTLTMTDAVKPVVCEVHSQKCQIPCPW